YASHTWQREDGLPRDSVQALVQTRDGYLWMGTQSGVARFDGMHFTIFDEKNTPAAKNFSVTALRETKDGSLWIGTFNGGLLRFHENAFTLFTITNGLADNTVRCLFETRDGALWIG